MSERPVEDEIMDEARKFSAAMMAALRRHSQAANWLERRKARKEISRLVRQEAREQSQARANHLSWTSQAVNRYRIHAQAVAARATTPGVDHDRDARSLAEHRADLAAMFVRNDRLTPTEKGIALDGLDAATMFPEYETGNLFARAHKVKGIEALRYRARVAREAEAVNTRAAVERAEWETGTVKARAANREQSLLAQIDAAQPEQDRYKAQVAWIGRDGQAETLTDTFATERTATAWMAREIDHAMWVDGTTVRVQAIDAHRPEQPLYIDKGRPESVGNRLETREHELREQILAGHVHRDYPQRTNTQEQTQETGRYSSTVIYLPEGADRMVQVRGHHDSEVESAVWTHQQVTKAVPGTTVQAVAYDHANRQRPERVFRAEGGPEFVADEVSQWWDDVERATADHGHELETVAAERDRLRGELESLTARHRLSIEHNSDLTERNARLTRQLTAMTAERDRYRAERDESVQKLAERTPAHERLGSPERIAEEHRTAARGTRTTTRPHRDAISSVHAQAEEMQQMSQDFLAEARPKVEAERRDFVARARSMATSDQDGRLSQAARNWIQNATDSELLAYAEREQLVRRDPSSPRLQVGTEAVKAVFGGEQQRNRPRSEPAAEAETQHTHTSNAFAGLSANAFAIGREQKGMSR